MKKFFIGMMIGALMVVMAELSNAQTIEVSHNSSKYGGDFTEALYSGIFGDNKIDLSIKKDESGYSSFSSYKLTKNTGEYDVFICASREDDEANNISNTSLSIGSSKRFEVSPKLYDIFSIGLSITNWQYVTIISNEFFVSAGELSCFSEFKYMPELHQLKTDTKVKFMNIGYKRSHSFYENTDNYADRLFVEVEF